MFSHLNPFASEENKLQLASSQHSGGILDSFLTDNKSTEVADPDSALWMQRILVEISKGKVKKWPVPSQGWKCLLGLAGGHTSSKSWGDGGKESESSERRWPMCEPWLHEAGYHAVRAQREICCFCQNGSKDKRERQSCEHRTTRAAVAHLPCRDCVLRLTVGAWNCGHCSADMFTCNGAIRKLT